MPELTLVWPAPLSIYDMNRLVRAKRTCRMADEVGRLAAHRDIQITVEEGYQLVERIYQLWQQLGFYPLDSDLHPTEWSEEDHDLPPCVLATTTDEFINVRDMERIMVLFNGTNIPEDTPIAERNARIARQRRKLVVTSHCKEEGCSNTVSISVGMAGRAIREYGLIEQGIPYEPSNYCKEHRAQRNALQAEKKERFHAVKGERQAVNKKARQALLAAKEKDVG